jgi:phospholipase/lecithinase/hemolysin
MIRLSHFRFLQVYVLLLAVLLGGGRAPAGYSGLISFGDSLSDVGNVYDQSLHFAPQSPPYFNGRYSNGPLWVEELAQDLGLAAPTYSRNGGKDYAYAGVKTGSGSTFIFPFSFPNVGSQISSYLSSNTPTATQLFTVWGGANDFIGGQSNPSIPVNNLVAHVTALANAGAKNIVVPNLPALGETPRFRGTADEATMNARSAQFNAQLATAMTNLDSSLNINIFQLDVAGFFADALANPSTYGFTNVTSPALVNNMPVPNPDQYLFWDDLHPTRVGHRLLGDIAGRLVLSHDWISSAPTGDWGVASNWDPSGAPQGDWIARLINTQPSIAQTVTVQSSSAVNSLLVTGNSQAMTLVVPSGVTLSAGDVDVDIRGRVELAGGTLATPALHFSGAGALAGSGTVQGNVTLDLGGAIETRLTGVNASDAIAITGDATFGAGGSLHVRLDNSFVAYPGISFNVLSFGSRTGDLSVVNDTGLAGLHFTKNYSATALALETTGLGGDANLDGTVNLLDFNALAAHFGLSGVNWLAGDFSGDGTVNLLDFNILAGNFGLSASALDGPTPQDWSNLASAVPEPALGCVSLAVLAHILSRTRRARVVPNS